MGDIADMMIDGTMCEGCGEFLDGESPGYPRYCSKTCADDRGVDFDEVDLLGEDEDEEATVPNAKDYLDHALCALNISFEMLEQLELFGKAKELHYLMKRIEQFQKKL